MENLTLIVEGMSCQHCVAAVTHAVSALPGVENVAVDLAAKSVSVRHDPTQADVARIKAGIEDQGYDVMG